MPHKNPPYEMQNVIKCVWCVWGKVQEIYADTSMHPRKETVIFQIQINYISFNVCIFALIIIFLFQNFFAKWEKFNLKLFYN